MKFIATLFLVLTALPALADLRADAEQAFAECRQLTAKKDEAGALAAAERATALWKKVAAASPKDSIPHLRLGQLDLECRIQFAGFMEKGQLMGTIEQHLGRAIELDAKQWDAHYRLGVLFYNVPAFLRRTDDAITHLERAIAIDPMHHEHPYVLLADLYERKDQPEKLRAIVAEGIRRFPASAELKKRAAQQSAANGGSQPAAPVADMTARIRAAAEAYAARPEIAGASVAVALQGKVLLNEGFGLADVEHDVAASSDTVYRIGSISKTFVAAAILKLAEEKTLSLDDPITKWLSEAPASASNITVRHLLSHTSGLARDVVRGDGSWITSTLSATRQAAPNESSSYSNAGYALLGEVIERAAKRPYAEYLREAILLPLGLEATCECDEQRIIRHRAEGYSWSGELRNDAPVEDSPALRYAGGLCSTSSDLVRWIAQLRQGSLPSAIWTSMTTPGRHRDGTAQPHALGFRVHPKDGTRRISHNGAVNGFLARVSWDEATDRTIVVLVNSEAGDPNELAQTIEALFDAQ